MEIKEIEINLRLKDRLDVENSQIANARQRADARGRADTDIRPYM